MLSRRTLLLLILSVAAVGSFYYFSNTSIDQNAKKKFTKQQRIEFAFEQEYDKTHDLSTNTIPTERLINSRQTTQQRLNSNIAPIPGITWEERGPDNVGGRTRAILVDVNDNSNNTVWAGGVAGGLWKSINFLAGTPSWTQIDDFFDNLAITAIAQDPNTPNTMYFGTGEGWGNGGSVRGLGIWETLDGGTSWSQIGATNNNNFYYVQDVIVDANSNVYAATRTGLFKKANGSSTWTQVLSGRFADLEIGGDNDIYATEGIFNAGVVWKSDVGTHGANTGNTGNWTNITPTGSFERIKLATAQSDANRVYVVCQGAGSYDVTAIFRSDNAAGNTGITWASLSIPTIIDQGSNSTFTRSQAWYDLMATVDPNNGDVIYIGGVDAVRSTNAGANWTQMTTWSLFGATGAGYGAAQNVHADIHNMVYMPGSSSQAIITCDGGLFYSTDANNTGTFPSWASKNKGYNITQFYACATSNEAGGNRFLAGAQDNGSHRYLSPAMNATTEVTGGDGAFCHIDQDNVNIQITSYVYNNYYITSNAWGGGTQSVNIGTSTGRFINPTDYDSDANILYGAHNADTYSYIRNVGTGNTSGTNAVAAFGGTVSAVTTSPNTNNRVFFGINGGNIVRVENANTNSPTATLIGSTGNGFPGGYVSSIAVETGDDNHLLVTFSNYGANSVWETTNGGGSWASVEGDLPDMPVRWAEFNPDNNDQALLATELGVWTTDNLNAGSTAWGPSNANLANTRTDMLQFRPSDDFLIAATHGRGLFSTTHFQQVPGVNLTCATVGNLTVTGTTVDVTGLVVENNGPGAMTAGTTIGFYLSTDATITTGDLLIGTDAVPILASGGTSTHTLNIDVSSLGLPAGTYFIGYIINYNGAIAESDTADNACGWNAPQVTIACSSVTGDCVANTFISGSTVGQTDGYNNYAGAQYGTTYSGPEDVIAFTTPGGVVTFTVNILSASDLDLVLMDDCSATSGFIAESVTATATETITATLAAGTYYLFIDGYNGAASDYELTISCAGVSVRPKVFLQGPLSSLSMNDALRASSLIPMMEPYSTGNNESFSATLLSATGNDAIVDWVQVELRDAGTPTTVVAKRAALLQRDGDVVDIDGTSAVKFVGIAAGNYYVAVKHRNHLSVMTGSPVTLN